MDDNKTNPEENQTLDPSLDKPVDAPQDQPTTPVFESVPEEELKPEEVAPEIEVPGEGATSVEEQQIPPEMPPGAAENNRTKLLIVAGGAIFFFIILFFLLKIFLGGNGATEEVKLTYWGLWEEKDTILPVIETYQSKNKNIKIDYQKMAPKDYREKLLARSKNGQGPDIFRFHNTWIPQIKDVLSPLPQNIMSNTDFEKTFYKVSQNDLKAGDSYYGIPLYIDGLLLLYNDGLFKKAGIQTAPTTWDEMTDAVGQLTVKDESNRIVTAGIALGLASNVDHFSDILGLMLVQNGATLNSLDAPEAAGALESFRKFAEPPNNFWDETMPNSVAAFAEEKVAMIFAPSWQIQLIKSANPDLELKVVPVPSVPGSPPISIANYWVEGVSRYSKNQTQAWKFLKYLVEKDTLTKLYELESKVRLFGEPYSRVELAQVLAQNEYVGAVIKQADSYVSLPLISHTYDNGLNDEIVKYLENAVNATEQGTSYADAFKTADLGVKQVYEKYGMK